MFEGNYQFMVLHRAAGDCVDYVGYEQMIIKYNDIILSNQ